MLDGGIVTPKAKRKSYVREFKLQVMQFCQENNLCQTAKPYSLNTKTIRCCIADAEKIKRSKKVSKRIKFLCKCQFPDVDNELYC